MSKTLSKYIAAFDYFDKTIIFICNKQWCFYCFASLATVIGATVGITSPSLSLVFFISNGVTKIFKKQWEKKRHGNVVLVTRNKSNSIKNIISKALK